jgi:hypothetical protein
MKLKPVPFDWPEFVLAIVYFAAAEGSLSLASLHTNATPVWPPAGIARKSFWRPQRLCRRMCAEALPRRAHFTVRGALHNKSERSLSSTLNSKGVRKFEPRVASTLGNVGSRKYSTP